MCRVCAAIAAPRGCDKMSDWLLTFIQILFSLIRGGCASIRAAAFLADQGC
jgi:hypothetical protein